MKNQGERFARDEEKVAKALIIRDKATRDEVMEPQ